MRAKYPEFQKALSDSINRVKVDTQYQCLSFQQLVKITANQTLDAVKNEGDDLYDEQSVAWQMGQLCYIFRNSCSILNNKYDELFLAAWKLYYNEYI